MAYDPSELEQKKLNTGRLMRAEADVILPLLQEQRENAIAKLCLHFRAGELNMLPAIAAEINSAETMMVSIKNKIRQAEAIERKVFNVNK